MTKLRDQTSRQILIFLKSQNYPPNWHSLPMPQNPNWQGQGNVKQCTQGRGGVLPSLRLGVGHYHRDICPWSVWHGSTWHDPPCSPRSSPHQTWATATPGLPVPMLWTLPQRGLLCSSAEDRLQPRPPCPHLLPADLSPLGHSLRSAFLPALLYLIPRILCRSAVWAAQLCQLLDVASSPPSLTVHTRKYLQDAQPSAHPQGQREGPFQGDSVAQKAQVHLACCHHRGLTFLYRSHRR